MFNHLKRLAVRVVEGPVKKRVKGLVRKVATSVKGSLDKSGHDWDNIKPGSESSEDAKALHHVVDQGLGVAKKVAGVIANSESQEDDVVREVFDALVKWGQADTDTNYDPEKLEPVLRNALMMIRSARDEVALPLLERINHKDLSTIVKDILPGIVHIDLEKLLAKLEVDDTEEGKLMKELIVLIIAAVAAARKSVLEELQNLGINIFPGKKL